ncbi:hypothetical protein SLNWT_2427 [Streptomyces albus]|uniref:Uncharacterized protein n=1 Tax=Streptomyces albus (strain ATCC 21838 / DSM 41398 / FERM P-419 / JCM 4703 / NBRC 107858) TaxID=1081613 RepID=A0A0B5EKK7_STRA4|nr:hypothetical protein SLNWT_2427 [Streptomyces albus]AOU77115.1 hypothetical protein SLNHY_2424 [Streptomyces albus]AYN32894.1 hypothetical protein DUI70_2391 [Streptomyces albus]
MAGTWLGCLGHGSLFLHASLHAATGARLAARPGRTVIRFGCPFCGTGCPLRGGA